MRRVKLEGRQIRRRPLDLDRTGIICDHNRGLSLSEVAKAHGISRAMVSKVVRQAKESAATKGS